MVRVGGMAGEEIESIESVTARGMYVYYNEKEYGGGRLFEVFCLWAHESFDY